MTIEERLEQAEKLVAEVKAELAAMRATKRNWPERIEAGMCFGREDVRYVLFGKRLASIESGVVWSTSGCPFGGDQSEFVYLGKIDLTIRTDAHEPTGAQQGGAVVVPEMPEIERAAILSMARDAYTRNGDTELVCEQVIGDTLGWVKSRAKAIPASRVLADGMVGVDREAIKTAIGLVRCLVVGPGSGQDALSAMESALRSAKGETTP